MTQRNFMTALDMLDEDQVSYTEAAFVLVVESTTEGEKDTEAEITAFVNRSDRAGLVEASSSSRISSNAGVGARKTPYSEMAGFSSTGL